ncbi:DUF6453 family protein [Herbiconiux daphne]|uniref:DUF6453 family protein n=1 Tax=Herbiconiux daphne TaxID=2970914 RepID=A0ABT2H986_9MICO|nr:DUF6453 family protein [Herbiconiux daphne]MCS5736472.1 DUF6453 family protein [Herbiconiux daphne]
MAIGIQAQPVGPGPAAPAPLLINDGCTFPQFLGTYSTGQIEFRNTSASITVPNFDGRGELIMVPASEIAHEQYVGTNLVPSVVGVKGMSISGNVAHFSLQDASYRNIYWSMSWHAYKIHPRGSMTYGVNFTNSADFMNLNDTGTVGQCIWAYQGAVGDGMVLSAIPANAVVFMYWDQADTVVQYTPQNRTIHVTHNRMNNNNGQTIGFARIVAFLNTGSVPEHRGGFNIYNASGTCTFSTYNSPFIIRGFISTAGGNPGVTQPMINITTNGLAGGQGGGWQYQHWRGATNQGGSIGTGFGPQFASWTDQYDLMINSTTNIPLPVLSALDYFA